MPGSISEAITAVIFVALCFPAERLMGLKGIAWALVAANGASLFYLACYLRRRLELEPRDWYGLDLRTLADMVSYGRSAVSRAMAA